MILSKEYIGSVTERDDLLDVYNLVQKILGDDIISFAQYKSMHEVNPNISHNIKRISTDEICGFLSLSFLKADVLQALKDQTLKTMELSGEHQVNSESIPACVYLGAIGAIEDKEARRAVMQYYGDRMLFYRTEFKCALLMRPVTDAGMKIALKEGYRPLHQAGLEELYILENN